jgi:excinuclease ABC subunit C
VFDNSNIQGTNRWLLVVFKDGKPSKRYRHFNIKTVEGPDDFASEEWFIVVTNAFRRKPLPNLIIDGGKGQLSSLKSLDALELRKIAI